LRNTTTGDFLVPTITEWYNGYHGAAKPSEEIWSALTTDAEKIRMMQVTEWYDGYTSNYNNKAPLASWNAGSLADREHSRQITEKMDDEAATADDTDHDGSDDEKHNESDDDGHSDPNSDSDHSSDHSVESGTE
jgi:hypothetical protein